MPSSFLLLRAEHGEFRSVTVDVDRFVLGRDPDCTLCVTDNTVSRRHAAVLREGDRLMIQDQRSRLGTLLNGGRITASCALENGDWFRIGRCLLLVRDREPDSADEHFLEHLAAQQGIGRPGGVKPGNGLDESRILFSVPSLSMPSTETASAPQLALLAEVSGTLQSVTELEDVLTVLLGIAFDVLGPERGAVLLRDRADESMCPAIRHPEDGVEFVSQTLLQHAIDRRATVVVSDVDADDRFQGVASLQMQSIRAAVCCPLISRGQLVGAIYLDTRFEGLNVRREEIGLLNLIACYAATAIENALLLRDRSRARNLADLGEEPLVMRSAAMVELARELEARAGGREPILIEGESGTGKLLAARQVHLAGRGAGAPFMALDCERISARDLTTVLFGAEGTRTRQGSVVGSGASGGVWQETAGGTLVLEHVGALDFLAQTSLADLLEEVDAENRTPPPRLIVTTTRKLSSLVTQTGFSSRLADRLERDVVCLPRLRDRREDILTLARHFLTSWQQENGGPGKSLGSSAEAALVGAKYREANVTELRSAIELAAILSDGSTIEAEHIFTGPKAREHRLEFDLGTGGLVRWVIRRPVQEFLTLLATGGFVALTAACLIWPDRAMGRTANGVVWGLWWPVLLLLFLIVGRLWCSCCPLSRIGRWAQSLWSLGRRPPVWIKNHANWIMAALFVVIVWSEHVFDMPHSPFATGIFLLTLMGVAVFAATLTQREVWCRFACPLGNLSACYSVPATVHVHANPMICSSQCKTHECYKGSDEEDGCPMFLHPLFLKEAHFCKLCMSCVRSCPNGSARLWLRPPLMDVWSLSELNPGLVPLALTIFLVAPVVLAGSQGQAGIDRFPVFTGLILGLTALGIPLYRIFPRWMSPSGNPMPATRVAFALSILAWGPLMAFHLGNVPGLMALRVSSVAPGVWASTLPVSGLPLLPTLQLWAILVTGLATVIVLWRIRIRSAQDEPGAAMRGWWAIHAMVALYMVVSAGMVI